MTIKEKEHNFVQALLYVFPDEITGTLSEGTMEGSSLISKFIGWAKGLEDLSGAGHWHFNPFARKAEEVEEEIKDWLYHTWESDHINGGAAFVEALLDMEAEWWEEITDFLNEFAPEGYYFGAHPGNGSDFGFWKTEDNMED